MTGAGGAAGAGRGPGSGAGALSAGDSPAELAVSAARAVLMVVDVQERLAAVMPEPGMASLVNNLGVLIDAAGRFSIPVVVSQQYPRGLGPTVDALEQALAELPPGLLHRFDKLEFSACAAPGFAPLAATLGRDQWLVTGLEAHVCVYQTARGLCEGGAAVQVVADAVQSRTAENRSIGLGLCRDAGAVITSTEVVVFDLLGRAGTDDFKALSRRIR